MTSVLDLFSDAPLVSMPTTATIMTIAGVLLVLCLSEWDRCGPVIRMSLFALILGLFATSARADWYQVTAVTSGTGFLGECGAAGALANGEVVGEYAQTQNDLLAKVATLAVQSFDCEYSGPRTYNRTATAPQFTTGEKMRVFYQRSGDPTAREILFSYTVLTEEPQGPCEAGQTATVNLGVGYAKTIANTDDWIAPQFHTSACNDSCQVSVGLVVPGSCYVTGLVGPPYPGYCNFETTTTGNGCTAADEAATQTLPPIPCPQGMAPGSVNGAGGCYKVSDVTKETTTTANPDGSTTTTETTTGPNGTTTTTTTCSGTGNCTTTIQHVGGGAGTGAPSETGQDYDGKPEGEDEGEGACGKEGLPDCKVKVNEDGTPESVEGAQEALDGVLDGVQERLEYLGGMGWVREDLPFVWGPSFPSGSCSAIEIYGQPINICDPLAKVRLVWAFIISFMAGLYIWRAGTQAIKG